MSEFNYFNDLNRIKSINHSASIYLPYRSRITYFEYRNLCYNKLAKSLANRYSELLQEFNTTQKSLFDVENY